MNYSVNLDITPGSMPPVLHMSQYDTGRYYTVNLKDGGGDFTPGLGTTAKVKGFNGKVAFEIDATVSLSTVTFQLTDASTDQFGIFPVTIEMTIGSTVLSPLCMIFDIQRAGLTNEQAASSPEFQNAMEEAAKKYVLGMDAAARTALLDLLAYAAYTGPDAQAKYDTLETALQGKLAYIVADYAQDRTIYDTDSLDVLKEGDDLIVTAYYTDGTHTDLADSQYALSGTLTVGTSTITVTYMGKTATFNVTVTAILPSEYQRVQWIASDGSGQYINTSIDNTDGMVTITDAEYTDADDYSYNWQLVGIQSEYSGLYAAVLKGTSWSFGIAGDSAFTTTKDKLLQRFQITNVWNALTPTATFDGQTITKTRPSAASSSLVLRLWSPTSANVKSAKAKIYNVKSYKSSTLISDLYPCYRKSDNVIGMYDIVTDTFYTNAGTGTFSKGDNA